MVVHNRRLCFYSDMKFPQRLGTMETVIEEDTDTDSEDEEEEDHDHAGPYVGIVGDGDHASISSLDIQEVISQDNSNCDVCHEENVLLFDEMKAIEGDQESKIDDGMVVMDMTRNQRNDYKNDQAERNDQGINLWKRRANTIVTTPFSQQQLEGERTELPGQEVTKEMTRNNSEGKQGMMASILDKTGCMGNNDSTQPMKDTECSATVQTQRQLESQDQIQKRRDLLRATFFNRSHPNNIGCRDLFL